MAIKGNAYTKTTWNFEERPVASSKLNTWDDRIEGALELAFSLLSQAWGGGDGVIRALGQELVVQATSPVGMSVQVQPGYAFISGMPYKLATTTQTADIIVPASNPRIDTVQARLATWDISLVTGTESPSPTAPAAEGDAIVLAHIYLRTGMTSIKETDDASNGYIIDRRTFV